MSNLKLPNLLLPPQPGVPALEDRQDTVTPAGTRDPMLPEMFYMYNYPQMPKPNKLKKWEEVPNFATDDELKARDSQDAWNNAVQCWITPVEKFDTADKAALRDAVEEVMGPSEGIEIGVPVQDAEGNWSGGIQLERGDNLVKEDTQCYTLAYIRLQQTPRSTAR
ncbi:hypothetical protein R3P38DRAFT_3201050 [Favolaschia claudopus]|uniref:Uncharacterized protein n=1 Tax=Favolaschia claudopus TaxID=2862362 RepID=A0AAW0AXU6_9AGAR